MSGALRAHTVGTPVTPGTWGERAAEVTIEFSYEVYKFTYEVYKFNHQS